MLLKKRHDAGSPVGLGNLEDILSCIGAERQRRRSSSDRADADANTAAEDDMSKDTAPAGGRDGAGQDALPATAPSPAAVGTTVSGCDLRTLSDEELADLGRLVEIAEYILVKHCEKKNFHSILEPFAAMIRESVESLTLLEDDVEELLLSAEYSIGRIRDMHIGMCGETGTRPESDAAGDLLRDAGDRGDGLAAAGTAATVSRAPNDGMP